MHDNVTASFFKMKSTLDEAPMAYKSLEDIIGVIREDVYVIVVLKPIYNFKATE